MFYGQDDRPNSIKLPVSWLRTGVTNDITLEFSQFTALSSQNRPCTNDPGYSFNKCVERKYSEM